MTELMHISVPYPFEKGFSDNGTCPAINFRLKSLTKDKQVAIKFFLDEDENKNYDDREPSTDVFMAKNKSLRPVLKINSKRKQFSFNSTSESILYFTSDYRFLSGTVFGQYEDLKEKKTYKNCVYYIRNEIKK